MSSATNLKTTKNALVNILGEASKSYLDSALIIFLLSMAAYVGAYCFELGYLRRFGVNYQSAHVQTESFVISFITLAFAVLVGFNWVLSIKESKNYVLKSKIAHGKLRKLLFEAVLSRTYAVSVSYWILVSFVFNFRWYVWLIGSIVFIPLCMPGISKSLKSEETIMGKKVDRLIGLGSVLSVFLILVSISFGMVYAGTKSIFKRTSINGTSYIVVREYNDSFILKGINNANDLTPEVKIIPRDKLGDLTFQMSEIRNLFRK